VLDPPKNDASPPAEPRRRERLALVVLATALASMLVTLTGAYIIGYDPIEAVSGGGHPIGRFVNGGADNYYRVAATPNGSFAYGISLGNGGRWPVTIADVGRFLYPFVSDEILMGTFKHGGGSWTGLVPFNPTTLAKDESLWVVFRGHFDCRYQAPGARATYPALYVTFRAFGLTRHEQIPLGGLSLVVVASKSCTSV
jgi:hypothetical protein